MPTLIKSALKTFSITNSRRGVVTRVPLLLLSLKGKKGQSAILKYIQIYPNADRVLKFCLHFKFVIFFSPITFLSSKRILTRYGFGRSLLVGPTEWFLSFSEQTYRSAVPWTRALAREYQSQLATSLYQAPPFYIYSLSKDKTKLQIGTN